MSRARVSLYDVAARSIALVCALNLNGLFVLIFDVGQVFSILLFAASSILILRYGFAHQSMALLLLLLSIGSYLLFGSLYYDESRSVYEPLRYYLTYGSSAVLIWGLSTYTASLNPELLLRWLKFSRNCFLVSAASVWLSPLLYSFYVALPQAVTAGRMTGFFLNPNEAAMVGLLGVALLFALPIRNHLIHWLLIAMAIGAIILTFSKTGITLLLLVLAYQVWRSSGPLLRFSSPLVAAGLVFAVQSPANVALWTVETLKLDAQQAERVLAVGDVLAGELDERTTTGRTFVWQYELENIVDRFPAGGGIGSAHHVIGGLFQGDVWQGVHNTFLMYIAEAGPIPVSLLIVSLGMLIFALFRTAAWGTLITFGILLADLMVTHTALGTRYHNLALALVFGICANRRAILYAPTAVSVRRSRQNATTAQSAIEHRGF